MAVSGNVKRRGQLDEVIQPDEAGYRGLDVSSDLVDLPPSSQILGAATAIKAIEDGHRICDANAVATDLESAGAWNQLLVCTAKPRNDVEKANIRDQEVIEVLGGGWPRLPPVVPFERRTLRPLWIMQGDRMQINGKGRYRLQVRLIEGGDDIEIIGDECGSVGNEDQRA